MSEFAFIPSATEDRTLSVRTVTRHRRQSWGFGGRDSLDFGMGVVWGSEYPLNIIISYMYNVKKYEMRTLSSVDFAEIDRFVYIK